MATRPDIGQFITTLRRGKGSYVPNAELGVHPKIKELLLGQPVRMLKDEVEFWYKAGYDYVKLQPLADFNPAHMGPEAPMTYNPDGTVFRKWASSGEGIITNVEKYEKYVFPKARDFGYKNFEQVTSLLPEGLGVIGQYGDIFTMTWDLMGFETFSTALYESPTLVEELNRRLGELVVSMFEHFADSDAVNVLWYSDDIAYASGLMVSPAVLNKYFFPWLEQIGSLAKKSGKPLIYHTDGVLFDVFDRIIACGVDAIHPIEPKAMEIAEVKQRVGNRLCLMGHVDVDLLSRGTEAEVRDRVRCNIEAAAYNGGYCVGSGNSIPEYVRFENYVAMLEAVREFGDFSP